MNAASFLKESQILRWFANPREEASILRKSFLLKFLDKFRKPASPESAAKLETAGKWMLASLLLACLFVPRLSIFHDGFRWDLRVEDFLLFGLLGIFFRSEKRSFSGTFPFVEKSFLLFFLAAGVSILNGIWERTADKPLVSFFYLLKWTEYFLTFVFAAYFSAGPRESRFLVKVFFILGLALAFYGYLESLFPTGRVPYPGYYRLYERFPFFGDANHVSGLMVLWIAFFLGVYLKSRNPVQTGILLAGLLLILPPFLLTYSRKSYFALAVALTPAFFLKGCRRRWLLLMLGYALITLLFPSRVWERLMNIAPTMASSNIHSSSWAADVDTWRMSLWNFEHFWLFGAGLGARHRVFYESQYLMILTETGFIGFAAYAALIFSPLRGIVRFWPAAQNAEAQGVAWGWIFGLTGMLIHNISCISGSIVKIAIPYWFLTGTVLSFLAAEKKEGSSGGAAF